MLPLLVCLVSCVSTPVSTARFVERERERNLSVGKNKEYKKEKIFYMDVLKNNPQKDK